MLEDRWCRKTTAESVEQMRGESLCGMFEILFQHEDATEHTN